MVPGRALSRHRIELPEWGSAGDWTFLIAWLFASGIKGKLVPRAGYLYRETGSAHRRATLRSTEEALKVAECLAADCDVPGATKE